MTRPYPASARRGLTHPLAPLLVLAAGAVALALAGWAVAAWAVLGGLAGFTLSGSV
ncbi:hypothetical protein [Actinophytocola xanthii]|uniref:hypothetical protein n=1 Tax=Actinophytocola xanthii TaxID=1912961 RepID=UPI0018E97CDE|nr:hypothetical protein [Actinophytocola xanthii]